MIAALASLVFWLSALCGVREMSRGVCAHAYVRVCVRGLSRYVRPFLLFVLLVSVLDARNAAPVETTEVGQEMRKDGDSRE